MPVTKPKKRTAEQKAYDSMQYWDKQKKHDNATYLKMSSKAKSYDHKASKTKDKAQKQKLIQQRDKYSKLGKAAKKRKTKDGNNYDSAKKRYDRIVQQKVDLSAKLNAIAEHNTGWKNEGKCAIYRSDGKGDIIYISPSDAEEENVSSNITSYPVDKGAPFSDYARITSKGATVSGIIVGKDKADSYSKFAILKSWNNNNIKLTYRGDFTYAHYLISSMSNSYKDLRDNIEVSITFQFVYEAQITKSNDKKRHRKTSKSSKSVAGSRNKKYTAITIKTGDTLYALSKKYGKSVHWMATVNKIKDINMIYAGDKLRVR